ncbi:MAG: hypothetical protein WKG01_26090 [Kofleriaceae bacterium]
MFTLCLVWLIGCGSPADPGDDDPLAGLVSLSIEPAGKTLVIDNGQPASQAYTAIGTFADGRTQDVTALASFSLQDGTLGAFAADQLTTATTHGGRTEVTATAAGVSGATGLTIRFVRTWNDPGSTVPADPGGPFGGPPDTGRAPVALYPNRGAVVPPNLGRLELHFRPGAGNTLFELAFTSPLVDIKVYLRCTQPLAGGCIYMPDPQLWSWLAETSRGDDAVAWSIRGTDDTGSGVGTSGDLSFAFAPDNVTGGIYYWTTTLKAIMRFDFGSTTQTQAELFVSPSATGGTCVGCHALSRDGTKLVAEAGGQNDGRVLLLDVATTTPMVPFGSTEKSNFESWSPDGSQFVGVYADEGATNYNLMLFDGNTARFQSTIDVGGTATHPTDHPDWSQDGDRIAFVRVGEHQTLQRMFNGGISTVTRANGAWGAPGVLVPAAPGKNRYYPAFAPDSRLLVFDESSCASGNRGSDCDGDTDPTATLFAVDGVAGGTPVAMTAANAPGIADGTTTKLANSFPRWNPFVFARTRDGGRLAWVTFSSTRRYGLREPNGTLLWMAAVDLDAPAGSDPSAAAFVLPFQDIATSNHIAQWTTKIVVVQ